MTMAFDPLLEGALRLFGLLWVLGGALALHQARRARLMDAVLDAVTGEREDRLVTRFLLTGGVLTLLSGVGLALASRWALVPLTLLVASQAVYFALQARRFARAGSDEARDEARVASSTRNAFLVSVIALLVAFSAWRRGVLE